MSSPWEVALGTSSTKSPWHVALANARSQIKEEKLKSELEKAHAIELKREFIRGREFETLEAYYSPGYRFEIRRPEDPPNAYVVAGDWSSISTAKGQIAKSLGVPKFPEYLEPITKMALKLGVDQEVELPLGPTGSPDKYQVRVHRLSRTSARSYRT